MTPEKKLSAFAMAKRTAVFAAIEWSPADAQRLRPEWTTARAAAFLAKVEEQLAEATLTAGWITLAALMEQEERSATAAQHEGEDEDEL